MRRLFSRARWLVALLAARILRWDLVARAKIHRVPSLGRVGADVYGGWVVPMNLLSKESKCYAVGVGEDISFDRALISRFNCHVYAYDPTPRASVFVRENAATLENFHFAPVGLWDRDEVVRFYAPADPRHVSHSIANLQRTSDYFEAPCKSLATLMRENDHKCIDLLKLDIEGAEYRVIDSIIAERLEVGIICVEYDEAYHALDRRFARRIRESVQRLLAAGYTLVAVNNRCNYTVVRSRLLEQLLCDLPPKKWTPN